MTASAAGVKKPGTPPAVTSKARYWLQTSLLGTDTGAIIATIFVLLWQGVAMPIIIFLAGLQSIPDEIKEAAEVDGANSHQIFWKIELPYMLPSISMVFILALKSGLTAFDQIFAMTASGSSIKSIQ